MWTCKLKGKLQTNTFAISFGSRDRLKPSWFTRQCSLTCQKRRSKGQQRTMLWFWWWKKSSRMASWQATTPYFWFSLQTWAMAIHRRGFRQFLIVIMWNKFSCLRLTIHKAKQKFEPSSLILWLHSLILSANPRQCEAVSAPWRTQPGTALPFTLGYFKGKTRVAVLMSMLSLARDLKIDSYSMVQSSIYWEIVMGLKQTFYSLVHRTRIPAWWLLPIPFLNQDVLNTQIIIIIVANVQDMVPNQTLYHVLFGKRRSKNKEQSSNNPPGLTSCKAHPKLLDSIRKIHAVRVWVSSKRDEMLGNFKHSVRGSIRKAPNIMPGPYPYFKLVFNSQTVGIEYYRWSIVESSKDFFDSTTESTNLNYRSAQKKKVSQNAGLVMEGSGK